MIPFLASHMFQQQSTWRRSSDSETTKKKSYYKLLKLKPMFIKLNVSSYGSGFIPQLINISMVKLIAEGYTEINGLPYDKWCTVRLIDDTDLHVEGTLDELKSKIWDEQNRDVYVKVRNRVSGLGPL